MKEILSLIEAGGVVAFCGSGLSAESGIPTFRGKGGLWEKYDPNLYVTASGIASLFFDEPRKLKSFLIECFEILLKAEPNLAHRCLYKLEEKGYLIGTVSQNVDDFHFEVGSRNVAEIHGNIYRFRCPVCTFSIKKTKKEFREFTDELKKKAKDTEIIKVMLEFVGKCPHCRKKLESGVVLFGQSLPESEVEKSYRYLNEASTVLCVGTSGVIYPAASMPLYAKQRGAKVVNVNPYASSIDEISDIVYRGSAVDFFQNLLPNL